MSRITKYSKYLLSLVLAVLVGATVVVGCSVDNSGPSNGGQQNVVSQEELAPAIDVKNRHDDELMAIPGVNGTGVGVNEDGTAIIYVFTVKEDVAGIPTTIEGFQTVTEVIGEIKPFAGYKGTYRPVKSGVSTGRADECAAGTIGCVVKKNIEGTDHFYFLSNNHVFAKQNAGSPGDDIGQPGRYDNQCNTTGQVADLTAFKTILFGGQDNTIDAAIAEIASGISYTSQTPSGYTPSATTQAAAVNLAIKKSGRTTGLTTGKIYAVAVTINVGYDGGTAKFVSQVMIKGGNFSNNGDSGSLIVTSSGAKPVALLFAGGSGSTFANPINDVLNEFGVTVDPN